MKMKVITSALLTSALIIACGDSGKQSIRDFIPGTYVKYDQGPYSKAWDTLRISEYDAAANTFEVKRASGFHRISDGKLQPREYETVRMMTVYDEASGQLQDMKKGKTFVFSVEKKTVHMANAEYHKID